MYACICGCGESSQVVLTILLILLETSLKCHRLFNMWFKYAPTEGPKIVANTIKASTNEP